MSKHPLMLGILGWSMVPAVGSMSFAVVCNVHMSYDNKFDNGLTLLALSLFTLFGCIVTFQTARMLYGHYSLRYLTNVKNISNKYVNVAKTGNGHVNQKKRFIPKRSKKYVN